MDQKSLPEFHEIKSNQSLFALESISDLTNSTSSITATLNHKNRRLFCIGKTGLLEAKKVSFEIPIHMKCEIHMLHHATQHIATPQRTAVPPVQTELWLQESQLVS